MAARNEERHRSIGEGDLHSLSDDDYFAALEEMPPVYDENGNQITGLFDDVVDMREEKRRAAERKQGPTS